MAFHLLRTSLVAGDLAARSVSPHEQAGYLVISFLAWTVPFYLYLIPSPAAEDPVFLGWMWLIEFLLVVAIFVAGVYHCLRKCRVDPRANFLIDFSCLYAPVAVGIRIRRGAIAVLRRGRCRDLLAGRRAHGAALRLATRRKVTGIALQYGNSACSIVNA